MGVLRKYSALFALSASLLGSSAFTACGGDDNANNQIGNGTGGTDAGTGGTGGRSSGGTGGAATGGANTGGVGTGGAQPIEGGDSDSSNGDATTDNG